MQKQRYQRARKRWASPGKFFGRNSRLSSLERPSGKSEVAISASRDRATASSGCTVPISIRMPPRHSETTIKDKPVSDRVDRVHRAFRNPTVAPSISLFLSRLLSSKIRGKDRDGSLHRIPTDLKFEKGREADDDGSIHAHWFSSLVSLPFLPRPITARNSPRFLSCTPPRIMGPLYKLSSPSQLILLYDNCNVFATDCV